MFERDPCIFLRAVQFFASSVKTLGEAVAIAVFIGCIMALAGMFSVRSSAGSCRVGSVDAVFGECRR